MYEFNFQIRNWENRDSNTEIIQKLLKIRRNNGEYFWIENPLILNFTYVLFCIKTGERENLLKII